jgi:hypothetical protein
MSLYQIEKLKGVGGLVIWLIIRYSYKWPKDRKFLKLVVDTILDIGFNISAS